MKTCAEIVDRPKWLRFEGLGADDSADKISDTATGAQYQVLWQMERTNSLRANLNTEAEDEDKVALKENTSKVKQVDPEGSGNRNGKSVPERERKHEELPTAPFPLYEAHVARFGPYARGTAFTSCSLRSLTPAYLPKMPMHPGFVHTSPTSATSGPGNSLGSQESPTQGPFSAMGPNIPAFVPLQTPAASVRPFIASAPASPAHSNSPSFSGHADDGTASPTMSRGNSSSLTSLGHRNHPPVPHIVTTALGSSSDGKHGGVRVPLSAGSIPSPSSDSASSSAIWDPNGSPSDRDRRNHFLCTSSSNRLLCLITSTIGSYWSTVEVPLGSIPPDAEIIAMHAFERTTTFNFSDIVSGKLKAARGHKRTGFSNLIVAVTILQNSDDGPSYFLNIYGTLSVGTTLERKLFALPSDCQVISLGYTPLQITHIEIVDEGREPVAIAVCDDQGHVHLYGEVPSTRRFSEIDTDDHFPGLTKPPSAASCIGVYREELLRYVVVGYASGDMTIVIDQRGSGTMEFDPDTQQTISLPIHYTPITSLQFLPVPSKGGEDTSLGLLATAACEPSKVLCDISPSMLDQVSRDASLIPSYCIPLLGSDQYDLVTCGIAMNLHWNNRHQILLGTFGKRILAFDYDAKKNVYKLMHKKEVAYPVYSLMAADVNNDGLLELVMQSLYGIHVFQYDLSSTLEAIAKCRKRPT